MQAAGTDVLGLLVDLPGDLGKALDAVLGELDGQPLGLQQLAVLLGERGMRLGEDALEIVRTEGLELHADRQAALQLGNQVARLAQVEGAGGDEQDVVGLDHAQLGVHRAALDQRQQVALYALAGDVGAAGVGALGDLVDLVDEDDAVLLDRLQGACLELFLVDQAHRLFVADQLQGLGDLQLAGLLLALAHAGEQVLQLVGHLLHAGRGHDLHAGRVVGHLDVDFLVVQLAFAQALAEQLAGVAVLACRLVAEAHGGTRGRQQGIEDALFGGVLGAILDLLDLLFAEHLHRGVGEIADDRLDVASDIADLGELGRLDLDERRVRQARQAAGDLGLADAGGADHEDVLWCYLGAQLGRQLHASPAVAQGDGDGALGVVLADDVAVEFVDDLAGRHGHSFTPAGDERFRRRCPAPRWSGSGW